MTKGRMPARRASMAQAKPVGPAPMQTMSYVAMGISVCRESTGIANSGNLLSECLLQDCGEFLAKSCQLVQPLRSGVEFTLLPNKDLPIPTPQLHAEISVDDVRRWSKQTQAGIADRSQNRRTLAATHAQSALIGRNHHRTKPRGKQLLDNLHL